MAQVNNTSTLLLCISLQRRETSVETSFKVVVYLVAFIVAILGNTLVISIVFRKTTFRTTTNLFIVNMAVSDLFLAILCMPTTMYAIATGDYTRSLLTGMAGTIACKLMPFLQGLFIGASVLTVIILAADRFLAIVYPFEKIICKRRAKLLIATVFSIAAFFNAPLLYAMRYYERNNRHECYETWEPYFDDIKASINYTIVLFVFLYVLPLMLVTFFYGAVIRELWKGKLHNQNTVAFRENRSVLKMVLTITIIFAICWLPVHLMVFLYLFSADDVIQRCGLDPAFVFIGWFLAHANSSINPVIYFMFAESFRAEARKILRPFLRFFIRNGHLDRLGNSGLGFGHRRFQRFSSVFYSSNRGGQTEQSVL